MRIRLSSVGSEEKEKFYTSYTGGFTASSLVIKNYRSTSGVRKTGVVYCTVPVGKNLNGIYSIKLSKDGMTFVVSTGSGILKVYTIEGKCIRTIKPLSDDPDPVMCVKFHPDDPKIIYSCDNGGYIYCSKLKTKKTRIFAKEEENQIHSFDIDCRHTNLISAGKDAMIRIYDLQTENIIQKYGRISSTDADQGRLHKLRVFKVKAHDQDFNMFLSGGWDNCLKIWDMRTPSGCQRNIPGPQVYGDAIDVRDRLVLTGSWVVNDSLQTWDIRTGNLVDTVVAINRKASIQGEFVYSAQFINSDFSGSTIVSGTSGTDSLEVISIQDKKVMASFEAKNPIYSIDSYGDRIVFGGMDTEITIADYDALD